MTIQNVQSNTPTRPLMGMDLSQEVSSLGFDDMFIENQKHLETCKQSPYFTMLSDGTLDDPHKRKVYLSCVKKVADYFQRILYTRQATCMDPMFYSTFLEHLKEEFGHNEDLFEADQLVEVKDAEFEAILTWFCYKMLTYDNVDKAVLVHLVFEPAGDYMCRFVQDKSIYEASPEYFHVHAEADEGHAEMGYDLLKYQHPKGYERIKHTLEESWGMFLAMFNRMVYIVNKAQ